MKTQITEWTLAENQKLQVLYKKYKREWSIINKELNKEFCNNRTSAQCRYQFQKINQGWSAKQMELLFYKKLQGAEWFEIAQLFPGKSEKQIQAKYNSCLNTEAFQKFSQYLNKENQQNNETKPVEQKLTTEIIPSLKFKHWSTPTLPNLHKMMTNERKIVLNEFQI